MDRATSWRIIGLEIVGSQEEEEVEEVNSTHVRDSRVFAAMRHCSSIQYN